MDELPPLATVEQLGKLRIGYVPTDAEAERAAGLLTAASDLIRDTADVTWVDDAGQLVGVPRRVFNICLDVAYRAFDNPQALSQRQIGDSSKAYDRTGREGGEAVYLTKAEEKAVRRAAAGSGFVSVTMVSPWSTDRADEDLTGL
ncbi:hypothetical protein ABZ793_32975 [Micromonospora sp. NPDC047465]|uniref:hypothetical protein n=1 Tax=Micromonospora sp. NPDC047465 TaxID=3154813 RepID=UPI003411C806